MLMLGHSWPLAKVLDPTPWGQHPLVTFINKQHRIQREILDKQDLLSQPGGQASSRQEEQESASASPSKDREEDEGEGASDLRCARCHKRIGKVSQALRFMSWCRGVSTLCIF